MEKKIVRTVVFLDEVAWVAHSIECSTAFQGDSPDEAKGAMAEFLPKLIRENAKGTVINMMAPRDIIDRFEQISPEQEIVEAVICKDLGLELEFHFRIADAA